MRLRFASLYRRYLQAPDHPIKLRVLRMLENLLFPSSGLPLPVGDFKMYLHPRETGEYALMKGERYEPLTERFLRANLKPGQTFAIAGANFGYYTVLASKLVGPAGSVAAFEPEPSLLVRTRMNLQLNRCAENVRMFACALGETSALHEMPAAVENHTGWSSLVTRWRGDFPYMVAVEPFAACLLAAQLKRPDIMILDVEGFELFALRGMTDSSKPRVLIVEAHPVVLDLISSGLKELMDALEALNYAVYTLHGSRDTKTIPENNLVAVMQGNPSPVWD